jgi:hypothetical protein
MTKRPNRMPLDAAEREQLARICNRLVARMPWRRFQPPLPPPATDDERRYRDDALTFALDRLETAIDLDMVPPRGK